MGEDEHPIVNGQVILVIKSGGNKRKSIIEAIFYLKTLVKVVEQRASRFGGSNGVDESVGQREGGYHQGTTIGGENCPITLGKGS
jgi:hypothetical protein